MDRSSIDEIWYNGNGNSVSHAHMGKIACRIQMIYMLYKFNLNVQYKKLQIPPKCEKTKLIVSLEENQNSSDIKVFCG
jgi:ribosomal protein L28